MSEFRLEPWELPTQVEIKKTSSPIEFGPIEWNGEKTSISARTVRFASNQIWAFFRPLNVEANFVVASSSTNYSSHPQIDAGKLERIVRKAIKGDQFSFRRAFYVEGELCLMSPEGAVWKSPYNQGDSDFAVPFDALIDSSAIIFDWLQDELGFHHSEVRFSYDWNRKNAQERHDFLGEHVPRWRELFQLVRAAARVTELPENATWILDHVDTYNHSPQLLARLEPWRKLLRTQFLPFEPFPDSSPQCLREYFAFISNHISTKGENASQHERLEARLLLREWLQDKATPAEIGRLLSDKNNLL